MIILINYLTLDTILRCLSAMETCSCEMSNGWMLSDINTSAHSALAMYEKGEGKRQVAAERLLMTSVNVNYLMSMNN